MAADIVFNDPDEHLEAINIWGMHSRMIGTKSFRSELKKRNFGPVSCLRGKITPTIYHSCGGRPGLTTLVFFDEGSPPIFRDGVEIATNELFVCPSHVDYCSRADGAYGYRTIAIPDKELDHVTGLLFGEPFSANDRPTRITPSAESLARFRRVHHAAMDARDIPETPVRERLIRATVGCLATTESFARIRDHNRTRALLRFHELLENNQRWPPLLGDICETLGIIEQTSQRYCDLCLGMSPHDYITNHRLNKARHALVHADPANAKVAEIAARYGFSDHSRFARLYRRLFDEPPSATLRARKI